MKFSAGSGALVLALACIIGGCSQSSEDTPKTVKIKPPTAFHKKAERICKKYIDEVFRPVNNQMYDITDRQQDKSAETGFAFGDDRFKVRDLWEQAAQGTRDMHADLAALVPPDKYASSFNRYLASLEASARIDDQLAKASLSKDYDEGRVSFRRLGAEYQTMWFESGKLKFEVCGTTGGAYRIEDEKSQG